MSSPLRVELDRLAAWYNLPREPWKLERTDLESHIDDYLEVTFQPDRFEVIIGGTGAECCESFSRIAARRTFSPEAIDMFRDACTAFPGSILGLKLPFERRHPAHESPLPPTLYVRSKCGKEIVFTFLLDSGVEVPVLEALSNRMKNNECFYGLGITEIDSRPLIKTYTLDRVGGENSPLIGFRSHRLTKEETMPARKEYLPDTPIERFDPPDERWRDLLRFLRSEMRYETDGHIGYERDPHGISHPKIYIERQGAIPTDFNAR